MQKVKPGDVLYDETGSACHVVLATEVMYGRTCNRIVFDDGFEVVADDEHHWRIEQAGQPAVTLSTGELRDRLSTGAVCGFRVPACPAIVMPEASLAEDAFQIGFLAPTRNRLGTITGSINQRREILRGFIEATVGSQVSGCYQVSGLQPDLSMQLQSLLATLGCTASRRDGCVSWQFSDVRSFRTISKISCVESVPVRCIQVDSPSHLYLCTAGCIATHNTFLMAEEIRRAVRLAALHEIGVENEIWYAAPTFLQAKRVMWARLKAAIPEHWIQQRPNETSCSIRLKTGHIIRIVGLDAFENLRGSGLWFFGGDEWADCRPEAWSHVIRPMLSTSRGHALFIGTPKGFDHFRDAYIAGQPGGDPEFRSFLYTTLSGGNVPAEEVEAARRQLDPRTFRQEYGASFESFSGRVIYGFSRAENVRERRYDPLRPIVIGMDFNINPMCATAWQEDGEATWQIGEIVLATSNTDEMVEEIRRRYGRVTFGSAQGLEHVSVYPDPAGTQRRTSAAGRTDLGILRAAGLQVFARASHPAVRDRINVMNQQFLSADGRRLAFVSPVCVKSIEAYERLVYREGSSEPDKAQGFDHLVDATGYYLYSRIRSNVASSAANKYLER